MASASVQAFLLPQKAAEVAARAKLRISPLVGRCPAGQRGARGNAASTDHDRFVSAAKPTLDQFASRYCRRRTVNSLKQTSTPYVAPFCRTSASPLPPLLRPSCKDIAAEQPGRRFPAQKRGREKWARSGRGMTATPSSQIKLSSVRWVRSGRTEFAHEPRRAVGRHGAARDEIFQMRENRKPGRAE
jgi:hypothetical protein